MPVYLQLHQFRLQCWSYCSPPPQHMNTCRIQSAHFLTRSWAHKAELRYGRITTHVGNTNHVWRAANVPEMWFKNAPSRTGGICNEVIEFLCLYVYAFGLEFYIVSHCVAPSRAEDHPARACALQCGTYVICNRQRALLCCTFSRRGSPCAHM